MVARIVRIYGPGIFPEVRLIFRHHDPPSVRLDERTHSTTHKHPRVEKWLARHPRFHVYLNPTSSCWLNMVERFFRELTQNRLRRGVFRNFEELMLAIGYYIDQHNDNPQPFGLDRKSVRYSGEGQACSYRVPCDEQGRFERCLRQPFSLTDWIAHARPGTHESPLDSHSWAFQCLLSVEVVLHSKTALALITRHNWLAPRQPAILKWSMQAELICFESTCRARFPITDEIYTCPICAGLLEVTYTGSMPDAASLKALWRERRKCNDVLDASGVWRYREMLPFDGELRHVITLREGNTALLDGPRAAQYAGMDRLRFKHQGVNPTGSFKDNGMTCGATQAVRLGKRRVACVSTGNTSASMAAYAGAAGLDAIIFLPHGNISFGKLSQALEYGARTVQVEANFDQILALVRTLAERLGIYLLNSINPFRIEGQKTIMVELMDQLDWTPPDWVVLPGGNLGNVAAFGKALREMRAIGLIVNIPKLAVVQAEGSAPFYEFFRKGGEFHRVEHPETLATAIKIGDPVSWAKAVMEVRESHGNVERVSEQEIADAKAIIGQCGIGCEPASAATVAGLRKMRAAGVIRADEDVIAVLTGNILKDPDYIYGYHTGKLKTTDGTLIVPNFANKPETAPNDAEEIVRMLGKPTLGQ